MTATAIALQTAQIPERLTARQRIEWLKCTMDAAYFIDSYVQIYDAIAEAWIPFHLWPSQIRPLRVMVEHQLSVHLKARQIGMTWLALARALHKMVFNPIATVLLFSKRDDEAMELLQRLKDMHARLPRWLRARSITTDSAHEWELSLGSRALAFPTTAGDSYTASLVICDEFDLVQDQNRIMRSVKPTIDNGGQMILLSRADKDRPNTRFKQIYRAAVEGINTWTAVFLPWSAHPGRDAAWYAAIREDILTSTGAEDELWEQYPETDGQALAARTLNKRLAPQWLEQCYRKAAPVVRVEIDKAVPPGIPAIPGLIIYRMPEPDREYCMGADPAEGLVGGDDSSLTVVDATTREEVARLDGKFEPKIIFPAHIDAVGQFYNRAPALVERNNHGHAVIGWLEQHSTILMQEGHDNKPGWLNSPAGKVMLYDDGASTIMHGDCLLHDFGAYTQLGSIDRATLRAPEGEHDDKADSVMLALKGTTLPRGVTVDFV